jgi:enamine deaminase RidA (YjgF/YER057c/UK114 family)
VPRYRACWQCGAVIERLRTDKLHPTSGYAHVTIANPGRLAFLAGQMPIGAAFTSASTLLGVAALGFPDQLVELELTAALP